MATAAKECPHSGEGKYLTARGKPGAWEGFLACKECLTEQDYARHPGWKKRMESGVRKAAQLDKNLGRTRPETEWTGKPETLEEAGDPPVAATVEE
jgi:hypothetical protein